MSAMNIDGDHKARIKQELIGVGMNSYGLLKAETRHLFAVVHEDEHIGGAIYGRGDKAGGLLVATNKRLLYLDHKLLYKKDEEISYDVISGVSYNKQGEYASVTVHTRLGDFTLRYVNVRSANRFVNFIENVQIEQEKRESNRKPEAEADLVEPETSFSQESRLFLVQHDIGVVSTIDRQGNVRGATIYYTVGTDNQIFFVTKSETHKAQDILMYHQVALTIFDSQTMQTLQISGTASIETDKRLTEEITKRILHPRLAGKHITVPPVVHISAGDYTVICIKPKTYKFHDYKTW